MELSLYLNETGIELSESPRNALKEDLNGRVNRDRGGSRALLLTFHSQSRTENAFSRARGIS